MSNSNFNVPHGKLLIDITDTQGFRGLQLVYDDHAFSLTRADLIGKSREELMKEIEYKLKKTQEYRETFLKVLEAVKSKNSEAEYSALIEKLKTTDPELCKLCGLE